MNKELDFIQTMFDSIAPRYDFLNRFLSLRQDVYWRKEMVQAAKLGKNALVLDVACGTCDVGIEIQKQHLEKYKNKCRVYGVDFSHQMLLYAQKKIDKKINKIELTAGNALFLPFKKKLFNAVFIAFGIRNIMDRENALKAFKNCLKKEGKVVVLELTKPLPGLLNNLYSLYFEKILPSIGSFFSKDSNAYSYLPDSVMKFPEPHEFAKIMKKAGFKKIKFKSMTFGIVTLFVGVSE